MNNLNPLFLLEGKYLDRVLNAQGTAIKDALIKNGIKKKGSELRNQLANILRQKKQSYAPEVDLAHLKANIIALQKRISTVTNPREKSSLLSKLKEMESILSSSIKYGTLDRSGRISSTTNNDRMFTGLQKVVKQNTDELGQVDAGGFGNVVRRFFGRPVKTKEAVVNPRMFRVDEKVVKPDLDPSKFREFYSKAAPSGWQTKWGQNGSEMFHDPKLDFSSNAF